RATGSPCGGGGRFESDDGTMISKVDSLEQVAVDLVDERLARGKPADLVAGQLVGPDRGRRGVARHVRSDEDVGQLPEGMIVGERLRIGDVEGGAKATGLELVDERSRLDRPAAPG